MNDPSTSDVLNQLSTAGSLDMATFGRRSFLAAAAAGVGVAAMPGWMKALQSAARPLSAHEGVLVLLTMGGGNDGLNTFVPFGDGAYHSARSSLAFNESDTLPFEADRGFNNRLGVFKSKWDAGQLALIDGVGDTAFNDLSHFSSMGRWMQSTTASSRTGWLGRFVDRIDQADDPFHSVAIGNNAPLVVVGDRRRALTLPHRNESLLTRSNSNYGRQYDHLKMLGQQAAGTRSVQQLAGQVMVRSVDLSDQLATIVEPGRNEAEVVTKLRLAARLINADVGVRVISIIFGDFDSHSGQEYMHGERMNEIEAGLEAFYNTLNSTFDNRTLMLGVSEFGRRVGENGSQGTDHGTANTVFAIGGAVNGGLYGQRPSLTDLDSNGNMKVHVDYRHVFSNVIGSWFDADSQAIIGTDYPDLGFIEAPGDPTEDSTAVPVVAPDTNPTVPTTGTEPDPTPGPDLAAVAVRRQIARLYLAYFDRLPDPAGEEYWFNGFRSGQLLSTIATAFAQSREFKNTYGSPNNPTFATMLYENVLGREPEQPGLRNWTERLNSGTSRGEVMIGFSESAEFSRKTAAEIAGHENFGPVGRLYWASFGEKADEATLHDWINTELSLKELSDEFTSSDEFKSAYGSLDDTDFVSAAYENILRREADKGGHAAWLALLTKGGSRSSLVAGLANSLEFRNLISAG